MITHSITIGKYNKEVEIPAECDADGKLVTKTILQDVDGNNVNVYNNSLSVSNQLNDIALGRVDGTSAINKFGFVGDVDTGDPPVDIWDFGGLYTFSETADINQVSSSSILDVGTITVIGLDTNWDEVTQTVTLTGTTPVVLPTNLIRCYRAYNSGVDEFVGSIYITTNAAPLTAGVPDNDIDVRGHIDIGKGQTLMCIYSVPRGKSALFISGYVAYANSKSSGAVTSIRARAFGSVFTIKSVLALQATGSSTWSYHFGVPPLLPEKSDILLRVDSVSANGTDMSGGFDIVLYDN